MSISLNTYRRLFLLFLVIFGIGCKSKPAETLVHGKPDQPNILIIYTDQQRYNTINALGNSAIKTPNLDKLVKHGTAFNHSYVTAPVCTPSRWSLFSGMYTTSHETYSNHHVSKTRPETSLPQELKKLGYKTALFGKNHSFLSSVDMDTINTTVPFSHKPEDKRNDLEPAPWPVEEDPMYKLTDSALSFLSESKADNHPVFMWLSYLYPHSPFMCPEPFYSMYKDVDVPEPVVEPNGLKVAGKPYRQQFHQTNNDLLLPYNEEVTMRMKRTYYGMVSMIDAEVGRIIKYLEDNNMRDNTLIVFTSDHGDYMGDHGMYTKSPAMYDALVRVPLIFSYPNKIQSNKVSDELVSNVDIMPTLLDFVGMAIPNQVQGKSLKQGLVNGEFMDSRPYVFSEYGIPGKPITPKEVETYLDNLQEAPIDYAKGIPWEANPVALPGRIRMIRSKTIKLVEELHGTNELYDLEEDPNELVNLYGHPNYKEVQNKLLKELHNWKEKLHGIEKDTIPLGQQWFSKFLKKRNRK